MDYSGELPFTQGVDTSLLLTDGTVLTHDACTGNWFRLTPDKKGRYETGTWSSIAAMPSGFAPFLFASQILPDGRMIESGSSINFSCGYDSADEGALYDPVTDTWTPVSVPYNWSIIGDAPSTILPNGSYMLGDAYAKLESIATISGTSVSWSATGSGKRDSNEYENWTPLPDGNLLTVDANSAKGDHTDKVEIYNTSKGIWKTVGTTIHQLVDTFGGQSGPAVLLPNRTIINFGGVPLGEVPHNDIYDIASNTWTTGPDFPLAGYAAEGAPAALLPNGHVLVQASAGLSQPPSHFFEFSVGKRGPKLVEVDDPASARYIVSNEGRMLELPTGQVLWTSYVGEVATYTPVGKPKAKWFPVILTMPSTIGRGSTGNVFSGMNFNGFSLGASYGYAAQMATNYPLVRVTNNSTSDVCFMRTYNFSTMGVFTIGTTSAEFDVPNSCETGPSTAQVIVNGLASAAVRVTVN